MEKVSIVLPAYNEADAIGVVLDALKALDLSDDLIVVDDGSSDRSGDIAAVHGARVVRRAATGGCGRSIKDGVKVAAHDVIVILDADATYETTAIPQMLEKFTEGYDMVVGARYGKAYRGSFFKMPARIVFKWLAEFATGRHIPDINSGMRVFRRSTLMKHYDDLCNGFSFMTTITLVYILTAKTVAYVPVPYHDRIGHSKVRMLRDSLRTLQYMTESILHFNPLKLFLLLAGFSLCIGVIGIFVIGWWVFFLAMFTALVVFSIGLIAESNRRPREP